MTSWFVDKGGKHYLPFSLSLYHQNIFSQKSGSFNTHSSNKHGDRISFDGLSVLKTLCGNFRPSVPLWLILFDILSNQESLSFTLFTHRSDICIHQPSVGSQEHIQSCYHPPSLTETHTIELVQIKPTAQKDQIKSVQNVHKCQRLRL